MFFMIVSLCSMAQQEYEDVLYLKNGSVIKGSILEYVPFKTIKIQTPDGSIFVYNTEECESIKKETPQINKNVASRIKRNIVPAKFSKKSYYNSILEMNTFLGQSKFENTYYVKSTELIALAGVHSINGFQFLKNYFIGIGSGVNIHIKDRYIDNNYLLSLPLFLDFRYYFLTNKTQPFLNTSAGVILPFSFMAGDINRYHSFISPSIGLKTNISSRNSINLSLGYTIMFNKATLKTFGYSSSYNYSYMEHEVNNQISAFNVKIGFTF